MAGASTRRLVGLIISAFVILSSVVGYPAELCAQPGGPRTIVIPIDREIDLGLAPFVERLVAEAGSKDTIILHINTFGGRIDAAVRIRDALLATSAHTVAFIDKRAISAGALIALANQTIVMTTGATMGAATPVTIEGGKMQPVEQKVVSYMRKEMKSTAEARGRRGDIAEAMVDAVVEIEGLDGKDTTLTLTTDEALKYQMASFSVESLGEVCAKLGCSPPPAEVPRANWAERAAGFLTDSTVASLLITLGMIGIGLELNAPGHMVAGVLGALAMVLFFFGAYVVHLAGWGEIVLFAAGVAAVVLEVGIWPGHGVIALGGALAILASLALAMVGTGGLPFDVVLSLGWVTHALARLFGAFLMTLTTLAVAWRFLPESRLFSRFVLRTTISSSTEAGTLGAEAGARSLLGATGVASTPLRPAGKAALAGKRMDVVTDGDYIEAGTEVVVSSVEGTRIVVQKRS